MSKISKKPFVSHGEAIRYIYNMAKKYGIELKTREDKEVIEAALEFAEAPVENEQHQLIKLLKACAVYKLKEK